MRIFSIHKSKSKKQISEKTPKLAAQKFLEKSSLLIRYEKVMPSEGKFLVTNYEFGGSFGMSL